MAIDKLIPRFLVSDKDERLLEEGAMTDALNVTVSEDGQGSEGIVKNVKGTIAGTAVSGSELTEDNAVTVIGSVSDSQRGFIYFFVSDDSGHAEDAIYQYNTKSADNDGLAANKYRKVFKNTWLNFDSSSFLKADVVNGAFQQDGTLQTIIYFTDNDNEPRKINVDRAIAGDYDDLSNGQLDYSLKAIRAPQLMAPTFNFDTDLSVPVNNFARETFQFATQYVYKDGEESAISPYSKLAYPDHIAASGLEGDDSGKLFFTDNRCDINVNWKKGSSLALDNPSDVEKIRLLARGTNEGNFFVIEEFNPNSNLSRRIHSESVKIYDSASGVYKFYNNGLYGSVDSNTVNKLYDNIPRKAKSQAFAGNRLFYSDYEEGRANHAISAEITAKYKSEVSGGSVLFATSEATFINETASDYSGSNNYKLTLDFTGPSAFSSAGDTVEGGSLLDVSFDFDFDVDILKDGGSIATGTIFDTESFSNSYGVVLGNSSYRDSAIALHTPPTQNPTFSTSFAVAEDKNLSDFVALYKTHLDETIGATEYEIDYILSGDDAQVRVSSAPSGAPISVGTFFNCSGTIRATWAFDVSTSGATTLIIKPYVKLIQAQTNLTVSGTYSGGTGGTVSGTLPSFSVSSSFSDQSQQRLRLRNGNTIDLIDSSNQVFRNFQATRSFKHGCHHDFGVVYYDKYNRSGNVNKIGGFYAEFPGERSGGKGAVSALVQFTDNAPSWADRYQIVYGGMKTYERAFSYTTGSAYPVKNKDSNGDYSSAVDLDRKQLYVSLLTLDGYKEDKGALRDYTYSSGDKLRVIKYSASGSADPSSGYTYPMASDGSTIIEFNVVGIAVLSDNAENPLSHQAAGSVESKHQGTFVIIEAPQVAAGIDGTDGNTLQYAGFDWFDVTGNDHPGESSNTASSNWGQHCVVEIVAPRKTPQQVYYEVGESHRVGGYKGTFNSDHGPDIYIDCADTYLKTTACLSPRHTGTNWSNTAFPQNWGYINIELESQSVSDFFSSEDWDKGRPHIYFEGSAEVNVFNGLTYSDPYSQDSSTLTLSSFNPSLANFDSLDNRYGAIEYIGNYNDDLVAVQENKLSLVPVGKNIIQYAEGSGNVAISTNVLGQARYSSGDYGCGGHPEAVLIQDSDVFFVDESRQAVMRLGGGQLTPISEKNMSSFFEDFFKAGHAKYVSGYDPRISTYFITGYGGSGSGYSAETVGYDVARGAWQSKYSFTPDVYANQNNMLYSANYTSGNNIFWRHDDDVTSNRNTFYGTAYPSEVEMVSKISPSRVKVYNALSYEGDSAEWDMNPGARTDLGQESGTITSWSKREGSYYASMPRDTSSSSTSNKLYVGNFVSISGTTLTLSGVRLLRTPIPLGAKIQYENDAGNLLDLGISSSELTVSSVDSNTQITLSGTSILTGIADKKVFVVLDSATNGDVMRGHYAKIKLTNSSNTKHELYCINTHITDSKSHHPLSQQ